MYKNFNYFNYFRWCCAYPRIIFACSILVVSSNPMAQATNLPLNNTMVNQLDIVITGKVTDANGKSIPGATITEKNTRNSVAANADGNFKLSVKNSGATLVVTSIGYLTQEVAVGGQTNITVVLKESTTGLNDVIVVGYGTQQRKDVTGAVSHIGENIA